MSSVALLGTDYETVIERCGLVDSSERGKLALSGSEAATFLQGQVTNDVEALSPGMGCYAAFLTPKGKMLGDVRILATEDELLLDTERVALQPLFNLIRRSLIGFQAELHKRTLERGLVSLVGPGSAAVTGVPGLDDAPEHTHQVTRVGAVAARAIRTDLGLDLLCAAEDVPGLRDALIDQGAREVSWEAVECRRVESGRPRYGIDLDDTVIPEEADLNDRAVSFSKGCYVGQETVARLHWRGKPNRHLRGLRIDGPASTGDELRLGDRVVGGLGSEVTSPRLGHIGLALVRREAPPGTIVTVGEAHAQAEIVALPFG